jgi:NAD(P)-dependent dehydrogenase (short-subunit alcohol dehydrogenase family)
MPQNILITGASGGFGAPTCTALAAAGHHVVGTMRSTGGKNESVAQALRAQGVHLVELDVTDDASVERGVGEAVAHLGGLDVVFNNAGIGSYGLQELFTPDDMQRVFDVNVFGVQRVMRAALPTLRAQGRGTVLYTSSLIGRIASPFYGTYSASKWALEAIAENYRTELSGFGIETCIIEPGAMPTAFLDGMLAPSDTAREAAYGDLAGAVGSALDGLQQALEATPGVHSMFGTEAMLSMNSSS